MTLISRPDSPAPPVTKLGQQRDWHWRGWRVRYTYQRAVEPMAGLPPLLLIHGFGAAIGHWRYNVGPLSQHHAVYAIDLLGFGSSQKANAPYSPYFWAEQVHAFWQQVIGEPVVLVGNSLGSVTAMMAAGRYPEMVQGMVWLNLPDSSVLMPGVPAQGRSVLRGVGKLVSPLTGAAQWLLTSPLVINPLLAIARPPRLLRRWAQGAYCRDGVIDDELVAILSGPAYDRGSAQALRAMTRSVGNVPERFRARQLIPQLQIPMLLVWGKEDKFVPPQLGPRFVKLNSKIRLVELDKTGHCPHDEYPERINTLILEWIQQNYAPVA